MKVLKRIVLGKNLTDGEMRTLTGGAMSNINEGNPCSCSGSTQGWWWCDDNTNEASGCVCAGNDNNTNKIEKCSCGTSGTTSEC